MSAGYIYVLQNKAFGANVIKIGLTKRNPDTRARELYSGATGVPLPFDVAFAYSVVDCAVAEKSIHYNLRAFRLNNRREFFRMSVSVGASVAYRICREVNKERGAAEPERIFFPSMAKVIRSLTASNEEEVYEYRPVYQVQVELLRKSPPGTSILTVDQEARADILCNLLTKLNPVARDKWLEGFTRDEHPERELKVWEAVAKAYLTLEHADDAPEEFRSEAFALLLERTWSPTAAVLAEKKFKYFSPANAKRLLDAYELRPKPLAIRKYR